MIVKGELTTLAVSSVEHEAQRPRTEFGVDSLKVTKLTLSDDIEAFITTFKQSVEAHNIDHVKWPVLLTLLLTWKA